MIQREVKDVFLRKSSLSFDKDINIFILDGMELTIQSFNQVISVQVAQEYEDDTLAKVKRYACLFRLQCGIRALEASMQDSGKVLFEIEAEHDAVFDADSPVEVHELEAFSGDDLINNAVWPYWKEHVASLCSKAGLSPLQLPPAQKNEPLKITSKREL
ncbi:TPA: protein-export chaperone SecB [Enterobacter hormaechei]|uniref:protein-export chaperone SecB n=1 Tax=Enterobacter cloacae complex TaxID=354276 RepID=UPI0007352CA6|nr:protein-export chaperone SecB [Enterobacter hormaechei]EKK5426543.1 protein-export chaperone SecB [Enterobacter hormaechei]KTH25548.1 hypothetical protein ASV30_20175 [Enterobacter hormaechei subsp. xiangfangensis]MCR8832450.1 protein-export chaperone SecB [Enterobacter hormaechei]MCR8836456.1 protein-export chaperone SecB [Enterobacter hormaechei]MCR8840983.1 protein-export chaperone SecB [Enterobacter hormaechei]